MKVTKKVISLILIVSFLVTGIMIPGNPKNVQAETVYKDYHPAWLIRNVYGKNGVDSSVSFGESSSVSSPLSSNHSSISGLGIWKGSNYRLTYCLGYGLSLRSSTVVGEEDTVYTSDSHETTWKALATWQKKYVQNAMIFGLSDQNVPHTQAGIQSLIKNNKRLYAATQVMIWAIVHAKDEATLKTASYRNGVRNRFLQSEDYAKFNGIWSAMNDCFEGKIPSFATASEEQARKSFKNYLRGNNDVTDSVLTITDSNGLLEHGKGNKYSYTEIIGVQALNGTPASDLQVKRSKNQLQIVLPKGKLKEKNDSFLIRLKTYYCQYNKKSGNSSSESVTATTLQHKEKKTQALGICNSGYKVKESYVAVSAFKDYTPSAITIHKQSSDGNIANWRFLIIRDGTTKSVGYVKDFNNNNATIDVNVDGSNGTGVNFAQVGYTDVNGNVTFSNLPKGIYRVYEEGYGTANLTRSSSNFTYQEESTQYTPAVQSALLSLYSKSVVSSFLGEYHWRQEVGTDSNGNPVYQTGLTFDPNKAAFEGKELTSVYRMTTGSPVNIELHATSDYNPMFTDNKEYNNNNKLYNQGYFTLIVDEGENAEATVINERKTKALNIQKEYENDNKVVNNFAQAAKEFEEFTITATINTSSAWNSLPAELASRFGFERFFGNQKTNPFAVLVTNSERFATTGEFYTMTNLTSEGNLDGFTMSRIDEENHSSPTLITATGQIKETKISQGCRFAAINHNGTIHDFAELPENTPFTYSASNSGKSQPFEIVKRDADTGKVVEKAGFAFSIYDANTGEKVKNKAGETKFVTNDKGVASFGDIDKERLAYGTYVIKEVEAPEPYILNEDCFYFTIAPEEGEDTSFEISNATEPPETISQLVNGQPLTDWDSGMTPSENTDTTLVEVDNADNEAVDATPSDTDTNYIPAWDSSLVDENGSYGYVDKASEIKANVKKFLEILGADSTTNLYPADFENVDIGLDTPCFVLNFANKEEFGKLELSKMTEGITGGSITTRSTKWGTEYDISHQEMEYSDIEFDIRADEDIKSAHHDGTFIYKKGDLVATLKTDEKGQATLERLHLGKYTVTEKKTEKNKGKIVTGSPEQFSITSNGVEGTKAALSFFNERQKCKIKVYKKMELNDLIPNQADAYKKVVFGLFAREPVTDSSGKVQIPKDALLATTYIEKENDYYTGTFLEDLPFGKYYVKELQTDEYYTIDNQEYDVEFKWEDYDTREKEIRVNMVGGGFIINKAKTIGTISGSLNDNSPTESTNTKSKSSPDEYDTVAKTGDDFPLLLWMILTVLNGGLLAAFLLFYQKKKMLQKKAVCSCTQKKKKQGYFGRSISTFLLLLFVLCIGFIPIEAKAAGGTETSPTIQTAGNEKSLIKTTTYITTKKDYKSGLAEDTFPETITENGITYQLVNLEYLVSDKKKQYKTQPFTYKKYKNSLSGKNYDAPKTVQAIDPEDDSKVTVSLQKVTYKERTEQRNQEVNTVVDYGYQVKKPSVPNTKTVSVKKKADGTKTDAELSLQKIEEGKEEWKDDMSVPFTVTGYDSEYYSLGGKLIKLNTNGKNVFSSLSEHEKEILEHLELDSDNYKLKSLTWSGTPYFDEKSVKCRKAEAVVSRRCRTYKAYYGTTITTPVVVYDAEATYQGEKKVYKNTKYTVKTTAYYSAIAAKQEPNKKPKPTQKKGLSVGQIIGIATASVFVIALIVVILYLLSKKKKQKDNNDKIEKIETKKKGEK